MRQTGKKYHLRKKVDKGANQYVRDPRQEKFFEYYFDIKSRTFANAYKSAKRAGYSETYARTLTAPAVNNMWIKHNDKRNLTPEHITALVENIAVDGVKENNQLKALELLAKFNGMVVDRSITAHANIETALQALK